jgi:hypothetical protein
MSHIMLLRRFSVNGTLDHVEFESFANLHCDLAINYFISDISFQFFLRERSFALWVSWKAPSKADQKLVYVFRSDRIENL